MVDEIKYWDEVIAYTVLLFTTYIITKDLVDENLGFLYFGSKTMNALFNAGIVLIIMFCFLRFYLNKLKNKEQNSLNKKERI